MKAVVAGIFALAIACSGCLGSDKYESAKEKEAAVQAVQVSAAEIERQMKASAQKGTTLGEYYKRSGALVKRLDDEISALKVLSWNYKLSDRDIAIAFIEQCNVLLRSKLDYTRILIQRDSASLAYHEAKKELEEAKSPAAKDEAVKKLSRANDDLLGILREKLSSEEERLGNVKKMIAADAAVKSAFGANMGLAQASIEKLKKYIEFAELETPEKAGGS